MIQSVAVLLALVIFSLDVEMPSKVPKLQKTTEQRAAAMDLFVENIKSEVTKLSSKKMNTITDDSSISELVKNKKQIYF